MNTINDATYQGPDRIAVMCYAIMAFLTELAISHSDTTLYPLWLRRIYLYLIFVCLVIAWMSNLAHHMKLTTGIFAPLVYYILITFHTNLDISFNNIFDAIYSSLRLIGFFMLTYQGQSRVYELFRQFMIIVSVFGIIAFLSYCLSIPLPHHRVPYYSDSDYAWYIDYYYSILFSELGALRLCGLFNEPGAFGTFLALTLCADGYDLKRKGNQIMFVAACCTFSIAFLMITIVHFILRTYTNKKIMIPLILVGLFVLFVLPQMHFENPIIKLFVSRLTFDNGTFVADNRTSNFVDNLVSQIMAGDSAWWGYGQEYLQSIAYNKGISSYKTMLINQGLIGFSLIYGSLIYTAYKKTNKNPLALNLLLCFAISIYQRPNVFSVVYFVLLFGGIQHILAKENVNECGCIQT